MDTFPQKKGKKEILESTKKRKRAGGDAQSKMTNETIRRGRWLEEEHEKFLLGLRLFGKVWPKVAPLIRTRTTAQVRSHAQKYFQQEGKTEPWKVQRLMWTKSSISVPPQLQSYMPCGGENIREALYEYLTPLDIPTVKRLKKQSSRGDDVVSLIPPSWYHQGLGLEHLLGEAENLDWVTDSSQKPQLPEETMRRQEETMSPRDVSCDSFELNASLVAISKET